ncbi:MAG: M20/M25/M40 family metallo-hydrolase, partial [Chloroflexota bacterium]
MIAPGSAVEADELAALHAEVDEALPSYLADLERLVSIDCGSYTPAGVNEVATWVAGEFTALGASVERRPDPTGRFGDTVIGTWSNPALAGKGPRVLLIGHMDTVFEEGTAAKRPFRIEGELGTGAIAYGPGVTDMKGGLLTGLYAIRALRASIGPGTPLPFERLTYIANPDEEIGSPSSRPHIEEIAAAIDV